MSFDKNKEPSKYIKQNLDADEKLVLVVMSSKGFFGDQDDIAITDKRIFARIKDKDSYSFPLNKIKNIEAVPDTNFLGQEKDCGCIKIHGPYDATFSFACKDLANDILEIKKLLKG